MAATTYRINDLQSRTGVGLRTLRHWVKAGLVPKPLGHGPAARYTDEHLTRVLAVQSLRARREPLTVIRARFKTMTLEQIAALVPPPPRATTPDGVPAAPPPVTYPSWNYEVVELMPGLLLMVQQGQGELPRRVANEIYRHYGPAR